MSPGIGEEAGQTARSAIDAMKSAPMMLGLLIFNVVWLVVIAYVVFKNAERWQETINTVLKMCSPHGQ